VTLVAEHSTIPVRCPSRANANRVKSIFVAFKGADQFETEGGGGVSHYESAIQEAVASGTRIRALLLCNPHNPLGRCYSAEVLVEYMKLCEKYSIHLIVDEIYATSVYDDTKPFKSILAIDSEKYINPNYLHLLYGFSKDLAGGGLRLGCIWTKNSALISALSAISFFNWPSNISDTIGTAMLENEDWMASFQATSKQRLGDCATFARSILDEYEIPYAKGASAGFFLWLDVRKFLSNDIEKITWAEEQDLIKVMSENKVNLTPGKIMFSEGPGFLRLCFAKEKLEVREGLRRFKASLNQIQAKRTD
jgi:1-aminocyclopropane-1-carboxylate synthase